MFGDILKDIAGITGSIIGTVTGSIIGVSAAIIATTLGITVEMVKKAKEAGCESYEEIQDFYKD